MFLINEFILTRCREEITVLKMNMMNNKRLNMPVLAAALIVSNASQAIEVRPHKVGDFTVNASVNSTLGYGDNVFRGSLVEESSSLLRIQPLVQAINETAQRRITFEYEGEGRAFFDNSDDNFLSTKLGGEYLAKLSANSELGFGANFENGNHIRGTDILEGTNAIIDGATEFTRAGFAADYRIGSDKVGPSLDLGYSFTDLEFDNFEAINSGRDYQLNAVEARIGYQYSVATKVFVDLAYRDFDYSAPVLFSNQELDNSETAVLLGIKWNISRLVSGEVSVGSTDKDFDNFDRDSSVTTWNAQIEWTPTSRDSLILDGFARPSEQAGTGLFQDVEQLTLSWNHSLSSRWAINTSWTLASVDFSSNVREDDIDQLGLGIKYRSTRYSEWLLSYEYEDKESNLAQFDFSTNTVLLSYSFSL